MRVDGTAVDTASRRRAPWSRGRRLRHLLLAVVAVVVAVSVVGMHQLSVGHKVATGPTSSQTSTTSSSPQVHADGMAVSMSMSGVGVGHTAGHSVGHAVAAGTSGTDGAAGDRCPGCGGHQMLVGICLLSLSLLVVSWMLVPPRLRLLPPFLLPRLPAAVTSPVLGRVVPSLSLTELSLRRT